MKVVMVDDSAPTRDLLQDNARLTRSLAEKEVLIKEVHHRVKNNFQVIASLLHLQALATTDPHAAEVLRASQHRVAAMAMIHEQLYESANVREIELEPQTSLLLANLFSSFGVDRSHICGHVTLGAGEDNGPLVLDVNKAIPVLLILNELISNSLQHAFPRGQAGSIRIEATRCDGRLELTVTDDGIGVPEDLAGKKSLGLQIVEILAGQLRGTWEWKRAPGTAFQLSFPET